MATASRTTRPRPVRLTTAQYLALPTDDERTELIDGEIVVSPSPTFAHNKLIYYLVDILTRWTSHAALGEVCLELDMVLDEKGALVYRPDLVFLAAAHLARLRTGRIYGPADLCVEIRSPSDRGRVQHRKFADYERCGVPWYWIVEPDAEAAGIEEYERVDGHFVCRSEVAADAWFAPGLFPGLAFRLAPLLAGEGTRAAVKGRAKRLM